MRNTIRPIVALWMYQDLGGDEICQRLTRRLESHHIQVWQGFDLRKCVVSDGHVWTNDGRCLSEINILFQMNADEQSPYQNNILGILESQGIRIINRVAAFNHAIDKLYTNTLLRYHQISVPEAVAIDAPFLPESLHKKSAHWKGILLKPRSQHGGKSIVRWHNWHQLMDGWQLVGQQAHQFYLEEFIPFHDHDYRVEVIGGQFGGSYSRKKSHGFKTNISAEGGLMGVPYEVEPVRMAIRAVQLLGLDCSIVDLIKHAQTDQYYILEVNPALGVFNEAAIRTGVPIYARGNESYKNDELKLSLIMKLILQELKENKKNENSSQFIRDSFLSASI